LSFVSSGRVLCDFCSYEYDERERLCVVIQAEHRSRGKRICAHCLPLLAITGCTFAAGRGFECDRLGTDVPPEGWEYDRPTWREQLAALAEEWSRDPHKHRPEPVWHEVRAAG
jgi:hypothetical protein